jgi:hypothetical protein
LLYYPLWPEFQGISDAQRYEGIAADLSCLASVEVSFTVALLTLVPGLLFALIVWPTPLCVAPPFTLDFTNYEGITR